MYICSYHRQFSANQADQGTDSAESAGNRGGTYRSGTTACRSGGQVEGKVISVENVDYCQYMNLTYFYIDEEK